MIALDDLAARVQDDLRRIAHPRLPWLEPRGAPDGKPALDVLVVGAGQSGLATAVGLLRAHVTNILVVDRARRDEEGPWLSYARMHTLRSPKGLHWPRSRSAEPGVPILARGHGTARRIGRRWT